MLGPNGPLRQRIAANRKKGKIFTLRKLKEKREGRKGGRGDIYVQEIGRKRELSEDGEYLL